MKKYKVVLIGAGNRGFSYTNHMKEMDDKFEVVAVADPIPQRREELRKKWNFPKEACYKSWEELLNQPKMADVAIISTMDNMHYQPAMQAIKAGYHLLLEKPVAQTVEECADIANAAREHHVKVLVCHVLRYTPFYMTVKRLIMDDVIGKIQSVIAVEAVGNIHQSHSYVRGDWHREDETTPMLLAKCCHDLDIIQWLLDKSCKKVSSFGGLSYFTPENAPSGAPKRCIDGGCPAEDTCPYNCKKVYFDNPSMSWMRSAVARGYSEDINPTDEAVIMGLKQTNFGACVYHADNNVVDHQIVNMEFADGVTASLTMNAFNKGGRYIRLFGTKGELYANASDKEIKVFSFDTRETISVPVVKTEESIAGGHGGGDYGIVKELYDYLSDTYTGYCAADIDTSVRNHMIGFAAEKARHDVSVENVAVFSKKYGYEY